MIEAQSASLVYSDHGRRIVACDEIDMKISEHEFVGILGPSGSGKSSLLYLLSGLKEPTSGDVLLNGSSYRSANEKTRARERLQNFGFVFQQPFLLGYLSAVENVMLVDPAAPNALPRAEELLSNLGLFEKAHRMPSELSGGEKQRVCVARALFANPGVVFADEPTASLDHASGLQVVRQMSANRRGALIMVTHDPSMLDEADRVLTMDEGRLLPN